MKIKIYTVLLFSFFNLSSGAQTLAGRILKKGTPDIIAGANIQNVSASRYNTSDAGGNYKIAARQGDTILFSSAGYISDTITLNTAMLVDEYDIYLLPNVVTLSAVEVDPLSRYLIDSARRKDEYAFILDRKHPVKLINEKRAGDAPGLSFSPLGYFSPREKQKRKLLQQLKMEEERDRQNYIDARFPRARIAQLSGLKTDSLNRFMQLYTPGFDFCRRTGNQEMLLYLNDRLLVFRKGNGSKKHPENQRNRITRNWQVSL